MMENPIKMDVLPKIVGFSPQIIHGLIGFSIIFTIHFLGYPYCLEKHPNVGRFLYMTPETLKNEQRGYSFEGFDALEYDLFFPFSSQKRPKFSGAVSVRFYFRGVSKSSSRIQDSQQGLVSS